MDDILTLIAGMNRKALSKYIYGLEIKTIGAFTRQLWSACLNYFRHDIGAFDFIDMMTDSISTQLTRAWNEGARSVEVDPSDMTDADMNELNDVIQGEYEHVLDLANDIDQARINKMTLDQFRSVFKARVDLWANRYTDTVNQARLYFGGKVKLKWTLGATEQHCETCHKLNGIVAYAVEWEQSGIKPQNPPNPILECGGWKCDCSLEPTKERRSANALERLMNIATAGQL